MATPNDNPADLIPESPIQEIGREVSQSPIIKAPGKITVLSGKKPPIKGIVVLPPKQQVKQVLDTVQSPDIVQSPVQGQDIIQSPVQGEPIPAKAKPLVRKIIGPPKRAQENPEQEIIVVAEPVASPIVTSPIKPAAKGIVVLQSKRQPIGPNPNTQPMVKPVPKSIVKTAKIAGSATTATTETAPKTAKIATTKTAPTAQIKATQTKAAAKLNKTPKSTGGSTKTPKPTGKSEIVPHGKIPPPKRPGQTKIAHPRIAHEKEHIQTVIDLLTTSLIYTYDSDNVSPFIEQINELDDKPTDAQLEQLRKSLASKPKSQADLDNKLEVLLNITKTFKDIDDYDLVQNLWKYCPLKLVIPPYDDERTNSFLQLANEDDQVNDESKHILELGIPAYDGYYYTYFNQQQSLFDIKKILFALQAENRDNLMTYERLFPCFILSLDQIGQFAQLQYIDRAHVFNPTLVERFYTTLSIFAELNYRNGVDYFAITNSSVDLEFESPLMKSAAEKYIFNIRLLKSKSEITVAEGIFVCPKCHNKRINYTEKQIRAADEPTSIFLLCLECNYSWRQN